MIQEKNVKLSKRLEMLAGMVTPGSRVADIGCDHGFLPIFLVQNGLAPGALAMDVRKGPLEAARGHIGEYGLGEYISVRISDGLKEYHAGEADTVICAGMGGRLMERILTDSMEKAKGLRELILQPQSELAEFRAFLREAGFVVLQERAVYEEGKYYFAMKAVYRPDEAQRQVFPEREQYLRDSFGALLLEEKNEVLERYLVFRQGVLEKLLDSVAAAAQERADARLSQLREELGAVSEALERIRGTE